MKNHTLLLLISLQFGFSVLAKDFDLCQKKKKQYGDRFISCSEVDWGVKPLSADYQPSNSAPMTAAPSQVKGYRNTNPGIKNTRFYSDHSFIPEFPDLKGLPLASKFISAVETDDASLVEWLSNDWYNSQQPKTKDLGWEGKCGVWASWSMDPQLQKMFSSIRDGILCNGIPFSKGELKEIVTSLYPESYGDRKSMNGFYSGYYGADPDEIEDANVALSKMGVLGSGDLKPSELIEFAQKSKESGKNLMMDRDPGSEIWNHPISKITDVTYEDDDVQIWESVSSSDLMVIKNEPNQNKFLTDLKYLENDLALNLLRAKSISSDRFCSLKKQLGETCQPANLNQSFTQQVDELNEIKELAYRKKFLKTKKSISVVKHELVIEYGNENEFASASPDQLISQSYTYVSVHEVNSDGSNGEVIGSQWRPRTNRLSEICKNESLVQERNSTVLTRGFDLSKKCLKGKPLDASQAEQEYFTGAVPPQGFKSFRATPFFQSKDAKREKAYQQLLKFMSTCEKFDRAVDFLKNLEQAATNNVFSKEEIDRLSKEYLDVKKMLDVSWIKSELDHKYQGVQGVALLKSKLKL